MRVRTIFGHWLPLAISFELMMLEGPTIQGAVGRLPDPALNLAAWGLTMSLALLIESPVIMLLATAIALVKDAPSGRALRRFVLTLALGCTVLTGLVAFTPLFGWLAGTLMGQPAPLVRAARPALQIMLFWVAAIAWRRFYQGVLVRHGHTRLVSLGTAIRLTSAVGTAVCLARWGRLPGVQVGAVTIMVAVITEAVATTLFARPILRHALPAQAADPAERPLTQRAIYRFHAPLAATTLLTLLAQPVTSAALARLPLAKTTLAAWPVAYMVLLVMRGWGLALQEITVAQARHPQARPALRRFAWLVGGVTTGATALLVFTPLLELYFARIVHLPPELRPAARAGIAWGLALPFLTAIGAWARGLLVVAGASRIVYRGMGVNLTLNAALLALGVALRLPGMWTVSIAYSLACVGEYLYLARRAGALHACHAG